MAFHNYHPLREGGCDCNLDGGLEGAGEGRRLPGVSSFFASWGRGRALIALIEFDSSSHSIAGNDLFFFSCILGGIFHNQDTAWDWRHGAAGTLRHPAGGGVKRSRVQMQGGCGSPGGVYITSQVSSGCLIYSDRPSNKDHGRELIPHVISSKIRTFRRCTHICVLKQRYGSSSLKFRVQILVNTLYVHTLTYIQTN